MRHAETWVKVKELNVQGSKSMYNFLYLLRISGRRVAGGDKLLPRIFNTPNRVTYFHKCRILPSPPVPWIILGRQTIMRAVPSSKQSMNGPTGGNHPNVSTVGKLLQYDDSNMIYKHWSDHVILLASIMLSPFTSPSFRS